MQQCRLYAEALRQQKFQSCRLMGREWLLHRTTHSSTDSSFAEE
ncbi:hypothetical protein MGSAQ_002418 [marine sediment metagenome]|uniref:Uncharacterized protein n=1 Tax=marine sediment metagenome TaxID=412755 RepID=A0A1B6NRH3_9ZZZZ